MKGAIKSESLDLGLVKELQYKQLFLESVKTNENYDDKDLPLLATGVGLLALNINGCSDYLIERSSSKQEGFNILKDIFDGKVGDHAYEALLKANKIKNRSETTDKLLIKLCNADNVEFKKPLRFLKALPENFDSKSYRDDYLAFCRRVVVEVKASVIEKYERELVLESAREGDVRSAKKVKFSVNSKTDGGEETVLNPPSI